MSGKLLQKLEAVHFMLQHHTSEHFGFLEEHTRNRTIFYNTLSKLLFMDDTPSNFKSFVAPLQQVSILSLRLNEQDLSDQLGCCLYERKEWASPAHLHRLITMPLPSYNYMHLVHCHPSLCQLPHLLLAGTHAGT